MSEAAAIAALKRPLASPERRAISIDQFSELLGFEPGRFVGLHVNRIAKTIWIYLEPEEPKVITKGTYVDVHCEGCSNQVDPELFKELKTMQTTGTMPEIHSNANYGKGKGTAKTPKGGGKKKY